MHFKNDKLAKWLSDLLTYPIDIFKIENDANVYKPNWILNFIYTSICAKPLNRPWGLPLGKITNKPSTIVVDFMKRRFTLSPSQKSQISLSTSFCNLLNEICFPVKIAVTHFSKYARKYPIPSSQPYKYTDRF